MTKCEHDANGAAMALSSPCFLGFSLSCHLVADTNGKYGRMDLLAKQF
jgi:hypothetical protein